MREIPRILWKLNVRQRVYNSRPRVLILNEISLSPYKSVIFLVLVFVSTSLFLPFKYALSFSDMSNGFENKEKKILFVSLNSLRWLTPYERKNYRVVEFSRGHVNS
jgi:hypothetical protein